MGRGLLIDPRDNVAVALEDLEPGTPVEVAGAHVPGLRAADRIPFGHKVALTAIGRGQPVRKYGEIIGEAATDIPTGAHVHVHNLVTRYRTAR